MSLRLLTIFILSTTLSFSLYSQDAPPLQTIEDFLKKEYAEDGPGAAVLITKDDQVVFKKAFGLADVQKKKPITTDMIFQIGSMTKQFTSTAVLQLVEQGKVSLDNPIQKYVPYFPEKEYPITIHHLLSQTSGIPEFFDIDEKEIYSVKIY